jgi:hypothetical protein
MMHPRKWLLVIIILVGGFAVLGSYVYGTQAYPGKAELLWGGVPENFRPFITANMLLAAIGYFAFTYYVLFCLSATEVKVYQRYGYGVFNILYATILIPSALWMPLTLLAVEQATAAAEWAVIIDLWIVGLSSLALLWALWSVEPRQPRWAHRLALVGCVFFCIQTVLLDAIVWSVFFELV